jgi:hypothetical protein
LELINVNTLLDLPCGLEESYVLDVYMDFYNHQEVQEKGHRRSHRGQGWVERWVQILYLVQA